jgi:hypothetical protein
MVLSTIMLALKKIPSGRAVQRFKMCCIKMHPKMVLIFHALIIDQCRSSVRV